MFVVHRFLSPVHWKWQTSKTENGIGSAESRKRRSDTLSRDVRDRTGVPFRPLLDKHLNGVLFGSASAYHGWLKPTEWRDAGSSLKQKRSLLPLGNDCQQYLLTANRLQKTWNGRSGKALRKNSNRPSVITWTGSLFTTNQPTVPF